jgi:hypothetical protein
MTGTRDMRIERATDGSKPVMTPIIFDGTALRKLSQVKVDMR